MIGQHATATIWKAVYSFKRPRTETTQGYITGEVLVLTADPSGDDLRQVTERVVMGAKPVEGYTDFRLEHMHRIGDVMGLVHLASNDYAWTAGTSAIEELARVTAERDRLKLQVELLESVNQEHRP
jgi:hypothetical protein